MNPERALRAGQLPARWRGRDHGVLVGIGSASAAVLEAAIGAWRADPARCARLHVVLAASCTEAAVDGWLPSGRDWAMRRSDDDRVHLLRVPAQNAEALRELVARADVLFLAPDAPDIEGMATAIPAARAWAASCARLTAADARLVVDAPSMPRGGAHLESALAAAGFVREPNAGQPADAPCVAYRRDARVPVRIPAAWECEDVGDRTALVVGGGLAGCASAWALAMQGWRCTLLEAAGEIGGTAAVQPSAVFHPIVHARDTRHARHARAAAHEARAAVEVACVRHAVRGASDGLLQLIDDARAAGRRTDPDARDVGSLRMRLLDAAAASALAGTSIARPAWWQADAGWIEPRGFARSFLERAGPSVETRTGVHVEHLERTDGTWRVRDRNGRVAGEGRTLVLANAGDAFRLLGGRWPVTSVRGQSSIVMPPRGQSVRVPQLPIAGGGYLAPTGDGGFVFGATSQPGDGDPEVRRADHLANLERLTAMAPALARGVDVDALEGRVGWRCVSRDRLPLVGRAPDATSVGARDVARLVPRRPGLFVHAALGSRGVAWCALGAQVLAALASGTPVPLPADLLEAIDPARFAVRDRRRASRLYAG
jgi:tRNA 5-methylaminomethyl-2-thiouridine biosynthesis bifunctional protein